MFGMRRLFKGRPQRDTGAWPLSQRLLSWSKEDFFTIGDSFTGTLCFGGTGSGKSSGSGAAIAGAFLDAGYGGLVLTAKPDERELWERYCRDSGRESDLLIFGPQDADALTFNFLNHEMSRPGRGAGLTRNIVALFESVLEVADRNSGGGGREGDAYWVRSTRQLMTNLVDLLMLAKGRISVPDLYRLAVSAATSLEQVDSESWRAKSFCFECLREADAASKSAEQRADFEIVTDFFLSEWPGLAEKTRSIILSSFSAMISVLNRGVLRSLFCGDTNVTPAATEEGKIILLDLPVKEFGEVGVFAQVIWKIAFQRHIERRDVRVSPRPVFLWSDEFQFFLTSSDALFASTCRSSRVATVYLTQNTPTCHAALGGGQKGEAETAALLGNLVTKVFHSNSDNVTNEYASSLIGRHLTQLMNSSSSFAPADVMPPFFDSGRGAQSSAGFSQSYEYELMPNVFLGLRTGGHENQRVVDAIVFRNGKKFNATGRSWMKVSFKQPDLAKGGRHAP